jgi:hypothetical protein
LDSLKIQEVRVDYVPNEHINYLSHPHQKNVKYLTIPKDLGDASSNAKILGLNGSGTQRHG